jgi:hypothetical protein
MVTWKTGAHPRSLGARLPDSKPYADRWPLSAAATVPRVPVPIGVNWYTAFDRPEAVQFGSMTRYFIGRSGQLGSIRGGHCVCLKPGQLSDSLTWWDFYDQGAEGITAYRWAGTVDEIRGVLQSSLNDQLQAFPFLNSWGRYYPHITWIPYPVMERLLSESGEAAVPTDR